MDAQTLESMVNQIAKAAFNKRRGVALSNDEAAALIGPENLDEVRAAMDELKLLMPPSERNQGGFELTYAGLEVAAKAYCNDLAATGVEVTKEVLLKEIARHKEPELTEPFPWTSVDPFVIYAPADSGAAVFRLPYDNSELYCQILRLIPDSWMWISGTLEAPVELIESGQVSVQGGYKITRFGKFSFELDSRHSSYEIEQASDEERGALIAAQNLDLFELVAMHLLPGFVRFDDAGFWGLSFEWVKSVAIAYLQRGYGGHLNFYSDCYDDRPCGPEEIRIWFSDWKEFDLGKQTPRPPVIGIIWKPQHGGGKREKVEQIIAYCESLALEPMEVKFK